MTMETSLFMEYLCEIAMDLKYWVSKIHFVFLRWYFSNAFHFHSYKIMLLLFLHEIFLVLFPVFHFQMEPWIVLLLHCPYSCHVTVTVKPVLSGNSKRPKFDFQDRPSLNATFIKLPFVFKTFFVYFWVAAYDRFYCSMATGLLVSNFAIIQGISLIRPDKKIPVFRVTWPNLTLLMKPRYFQVFYYIFFQMPFKMHKIINFFEKKKVIKKCVPNLPKMFQPVTQNTLIFFYLALFINHFCRNCLTKILSTMCIFDEMPFRWKCF